MTISARHACFVEMVVPVAFGEQHLEQAEIKCLNTECSGYLSINIKLKSRQLVIPPRVAQLVMDMAQNEHGYMHVLRKNHQMFRFCWQCCFIQL